MAINTDAVQRLYVAYFNRPSDPLGQAYWESLLPTTRAATQAELTAIANSFSGSAEYTALYAGQTNAQIINNLYLNLFGRSAEVGGLTSWANALTAGTQTFASIALQLTFSAQGTDATAIASKLAAANSFTTSLNTTALITGYSGTAAAASARTWLATVVDSATQATAIVPATLSAAVTAATSGGATGTTFTLTTGTDSIVGTANNDTINGTANASGATFTSGDTINGGAGTDTLNLSDLGTGALWNPTALAGVTVTNVENANFNAVGGVTVNTTGTQLWTGLTRLTVNSATTGTVVDTLTAAATTAVVLTDVIGALTTADGITVNGGSTVTISEANAGLNESARTINVTGVSGTTTVSVTQTGTSAGGSQAVTINDVNQGTTTAGTITTVTLDGLDTQAAAVKSNALSSLTINQVKTGGATITVTETANAASLSTVLALNLNTSASQTLVTTSAFTGATIAEAAALYKTFNITVGGTSTTAGVNNFVIAAFSGDTAVTTVTVAGTGELIDKAGFASNATNLAAVSSLTISGTAGLSMDLSTMGATAGALTSITATNTGSNINNLTLSGTVQSYSHTGSATDIITIAARETKTVTAGSATNNEIVFNAAGPGTGVGLTNGGTLTGFTVLGTGASSTGTYDMLAITGITAIDVQGTTAGNLTYSNVTSGTTLAIDSDNNARSVTYQLANSLGASNSLSLSLGLAATDQRVLTSLLAKTTAGFTATSVLAAKDSAGVGVGTLNIASYASTAGQVNTITNLDDTKLATLNISGTGGVVFTNNTTTTDTATTMTIANASTSTAASGFTTLTDNALTSLTFSGAGLTSIGTLSDTAATQTITQNDTNATAASIGTLAGGATLSQLNIAGTNALNITTGITGSSAILGIANTNASATASVITGLTDNSLATFTISGSGKTTITTLTDGLSGALTVIDSGSGAFIDSTLAATALTALTLQNSGTGTFTVGAHAVGTTLAALNLLGQVAYTGTNIAITTALTVTGGSDNANVSLTMAGTQGAVTDSITLGNGNNTVAFTANGGGNTSIRSVTVGNGNNTITDSSAGATGQDLVSVGSGTNTVTFGATHTAVDTLTFTAANGASTTILTTLTALAADTITWATAALNTTITHSGAVASVAAGMAAVSSTNGYTDFTFGSNTYIYENTGTAATNELVVVVGTHTLASATTAVGTLA